MHVLQIVCYTAACTRAPLGLQHPSLLPRSRTAAGPNDDALRRATTGRASKELELGDGDGDGDGEVHADGRLEYGGGERDEDGPRALAHPGTDVDVVGDEMKKPRCVYNVETALRARGRGGDVGAAPPCAYRWVLRMHLETEVQSGAWMYVLPIALALALSPVLVVVEHGYFGFSLESPRYCMHPRPRTYSMDVEPARVPARAQGTSMSRLGHHFLAAVCPLAFLVECGLRMQRNRRGWGVRVRVRLRVLPPLAGAGFAPPLLLYIYAHTSLGTARRGVGVYVSHRARRAHTLLRSDGASECSPHHGVALLPLAGTASIYIPPLSSRLIRLDLFFFARFFFVLHPDTHPPALWCPFSGIPIYTLPRPRPRPRPIRKHDHRG
ncbi:hypothetical protein B0H13DRAFT_2549418 [Mycena leptocephala]|nr:hypothetical protein B0H13DRAFT_2549418 [Mycena leptocephala]